MLPVMACASYGTLPTCTAVAGTQRSIVIHPCTASFDGTFCWMNWIEAKRWTLRTLASVREILSHLVHGWTVTTESAGALPVDRNVMMTRADRFTQVHDVEIAVHEN